jgi:hypothetical protein
LLNVALHFIGNSQDFPIFPILRAHLFILGDYLGDDPRLVANSLIEVGTILSDLSFGLYFDISADLCIHVPHHLFNLVTLDSLVHSEFALGNLCFVDTF